MAKLFKARYYPNSNFLATKLGDSSSFVWRSVLEDRNVIKFRVIRRVGLGLSVNILEDPWMPDVNNVSVTTKNKALKGNTVSAFFETGENK